MFEDERIVRLACGSGARFYQSSVAVPSSAERLALIRLHGVLEKSLVEPFRPDYQQVLEAARARLRAQFGDA